jgi:hypothetical protein
MKAKSDRYGEHESLEKLGVEIHTMGDGFTWDTNDPAKDIETSETTWALCIEKMQSEEYDLLVFDEIVYVLDYKFLDVAKVLDEVKANREKQAALAYHHDRTKRTGGACRSGGPRHRNERDQTSVSRGHLRTAGNRILTVVCYSETPSSWQKKKSKSASRTVYLITFHSPSRHSASDTCLSHRERGGRLSR